MYAAGLAPARAEVTPQPASTAAQSTIKSQFNHRSWTSKDGAPEAIAAIAQTSDGWLWLAANAGLFRFDGATFEEIPLIPPGSYTSRDLFTLFVRHNGDLWVVFGNDGHAAALIGGNPHRIVDAPRLPNSSLMEALAEDGTGRMWAFTHAGQKYLLRDDHWEGGTEAFGLPPGKVSYTALDGRGTLWVQMDNGIFSLPKGAEEFKPSGMAMRGDTFIGSSRSGQFWMADGNGWEPLAQAPTAPTPALASVDQSTDAVWSRDGSLWVASPKGVKRTSIEQRTDFFTPAAGDDVFTASDGLTSNHVMTLFEDHEGNVWVGTKRGLDQFRRTDLQKVLFPSSALYMAMVPDPVSGIWLGTDNNYYTEKDYIWRLNPTPQPIQETPKRGATSALLEADGSVLFGTTEKLIRISNGKVSDVDGPPGNSGNSIRTLIRDDTGHLWSSRRNVLYRLDGDHWVLHGGIDSFPDRVSAIRAFDERLGTWIGLLDRRVLQLRAGAIHIYSQDDGLTVGAAKAFLLGNPSLIAGELGMNVFDGTHFTPFEVQGIGPMKDVSGMLRTADGDLWLNGRVGLVRIKAAEYAKAIADHSYRPAAKVFTTEDGIPGTAQNSIAGPTLIEDKQHRLWVAASDGLAVLDPTTLKTNTHPPHVEIRHITAADRIFPPTTAIQLPKYTRIATIFYTALSLSVPERVTFRVHLSGVDAEWRDVGNARSISYSNLTPGAYRFEVLAANNDGVWNTQSASIDFEIAPAFYQTLWFKGLLWLLAACAVIAIIRLQSRRLAWRESAKLRDRMQERERIARELHDTLIQDAEAMVLNLRALNQRDTGTPPPEELMKLELAAQRSVDMARDRVGGLRAEAQSEEYLSNSLKELAERLTALYPVPYTFLAEGPTHPLHSMVTEEILAIGREAILNAFRHSRASHIGIRVRYESKALVVTVADNGIGLAGVERAQQGHWGLIGMSERAAHLKATLTISPDKESGTLVTLVVPAAVAYSNKQPWWAFWRAPQTTSG